MPDFVQRSGQVAVAVCPALKPACLTALYLSRTTQHVSQTSRTCSGLALLQLNFAAY
jgi:hypothetical protein